MTAAVFVQIAEYFKKIHTDLVWPTASATPQTPGAAGGAGAPQNPGGLPVFGQDKLHELRDALLNGYVKAIQVFELSYPCNTNDDCLNQNEVCIKGECVPKPGTHGPEGLTRCNSNDDCLNQNEVCIGGFCVPDPYALDFASNAFVPDQVYLDALQVAFHAYYAQIQGVLTAGLGKDPSKLPQVRDYLMGVYSSFAAIAGKPPCKVNSDCGNGMACVRGYCVPYPFRLVFRVPGSPLKAPWTL